MCSSVTHFLFIFKMISFGADALDGCISLENKIGNKFYVNLIGNATELSWTWL